MNWNVLWTALGETLYMAIPSTLIAYLIGLPLGVLLVITRKGGVKPLPTLNAVVGALVNFLRSIPFLILNIICVVVIAIFPAIVTFIPGLSA